MTMTINSDNRPVDLDLQQLLADLMEQRGIPGLQFAAIRGGEILALEALGTADVEHDVPVTHESVFSINSMTKAFTGVALMQLVEAGLLDLEAPIGQYLEDLPATWRSITVRQLATLTSGVPEIMEYSPEGSARLIGDGDEESAWAAAYAMPMQFETGRGYNYVQTNFALLGKIIDQLAGKPFSAFITEKQFDVAGMPSTVYADDRDIIRHRANTYMSIDPDGEPNGRFDNSFINWPPLVRTAAGLHSTASDLANWLIALQAGKLLKDQSSLDELWTPTPQYTGEPGLWGIGWIISQSPTGNVPAPGGGAKAQLALYPNGLSLVLLTNLLGAFVAEHMGVPANKPMDISFMDAFAEHYNRED